MSKPERDYYAELHAAQLAVRREFERDDARLSIVLDGAVALWFAFLAGAGICSDRLVVALVAGACSLLVGFVVVRNVWRAT